jgi:hypothetical protein
MKNSRVYPIGMGRALRDSYLRTNLSQRIEGIYWYPKVHNMTLKLAKKYNRPLFQVAGIIAALSPRNKFGRNMVDAESILRDGRAAVVATFGANKRKALCILEALDYDEVLDILNGNKVKAFYSNIYHAGHDKEVTIDVWMMRLMGIEGAMSDQKYQDIAFAVRTIAQQLRLSPKALQAVTWIEARGAAF